MDKFKHLIYTVEDQIAIITFNRPKYLNALNSEMLKELSDVTDHIGADASIRAVILTGAGEKAFVAGADIAEMRSKNAMEGRKFSQFGNWVLSKLENLPQPVIAAINGFALGGGCELALACDIRIASTRAKLGQPEVILGIMPGFGGSQRLPRLVGLGIAKELLFTGDMITADRAREIGLINHVVEPSELLTKAKEIAGNIAAKSPLGVQFSKKAVNEGFDLDLERSLSLETEMFGMLFSTEDQKEGMTAFLEKRKPVYQGK
ncbi:enoyl-CoA hydratase-related protein [Paenibacillus sp. GP183]|jgi:enoyl-CoA hydratase|uniref:enoyl-CoA hydratase-related protein n=1 Tax=Paenibacillus sp. GP183 TaxID=1882751 RepID=UPI00089CA4D1|nr:enoyl-CoA hydratase-related protein [Paenibacillus sp. GP183]SEC76855.1 enoyl-CoA hydratase [Paenibacillus sp. GP183]